MAEDAFLAKLERTLRRFEMLRTGDRLGVACSGGPDSTALLEAVCELGPGFGLSSIVVVHLDHMLRGTDSESDARFVEDLARRKGLECMVDRIDVSQAAADRGENLEQAGRRSRYELFEGLIKSGRIDRIATGHTRSDQAETVLFRLLRGTGRRGLAGVRPKREPGVLRPLIEHSRAEILEWLAARGVAYRDDPSNRDLGFDRNRIRLELLPQLVREWNPRIEQALAQLAQQSALEEPWLNQLIDAELEQLASAQPGGGVVVDCVRAAALHPAALTRALQRLLERLGCPMPGSFHLTALCELAQARRGAGALDLPGASARRSFDRLLLLPAGPDAAPRAPLAVAPPQTAAAWDGRTRIELSVHRIEPGSPGYNERHWALLDWDRLPKPLHLRGWRSGDRLEAPDRAKGRKLKDLFHSARVAVWDRQNWPVLAAPRVGGGRVDEVVWARGFGPAPGYAMDESTVTALKVREITADGKEIHRIKDWVASVYNG